MWGDYALFGKRRWVWVINTGVYDYIDVLGKAANASWKRNEVINNNIANVDTPGYKRKDVSFDDLLAIQLKHTGTTQVDLDTRVANIDQKRLEGRIYTDSTAYSYRIDGNNVDIDTENVELASNQIKYNGLVSSINAEFARIKSVIK